MHIIELKGKVEHGGFCYSFTYEHEEELAMLYMNCEKSLCSTCMPLPEMQQLFIEFEAAVAELREEAKEEAYESKAETELELFQNKYSSRQIVAALRAVGLTNSLGG